MQHKKPTRFHRIDRDMPKQHVEDDTGHLWAVSYADFLMVLLSFFILFFSVSQKDKDTIVNIVENAKERGLGSGNGGGFATKPTNIAPSRNPAQIAHEIEKDLNGIKYETNDKTKSVTFMLADEIYRQGNIFPNAAGKTALLKLIALLKPYENEIDVIFVGHTDSVPVKKDKIAAIDNNFDLSALRAASAVRIAMSQGMPMSRLFTHGSADNTRKTKSLSVIVKPRGGGSI